MTTLTLTIIDLDPNKLKAVKEVFDGDSHVTWVLGDIKALVGYDCLVTPGNSFGIMDGGFDAVVANMLPLAERQVQQAIEEAHCGELNVGDAVLIQPVPTGPALIYAPTMRVPMTITRTDNIYRAMRAALLKIRRHNEGDGSENEQHVLRTIATPILGAGAGNVPAPQAARQMKLAWDSMNQRRPVTWQKADSIQAAIGRGLGGDPDNY